MNGCLFGEFVKLRMTSAQVGSPGRGARSACASSSPHSASNTQLPWRPIKCSPAIRVNPTSSNWPAERDHMPTSVREAFEAFRHAPSNYERGAKFEKLIVWITPASPQTRCGAGSFTRLISPRPLSACPGAPRMARAARASVPWRRRTTGVACRGTRPSVDTYSRRSACGNARSRPRP
jgi:hypothetical protein